MTSIVKSLAIAGIATVALTGGAVAQDTRDNHSHRWFFYSLSVFNRCGRTVRTDQRLPPPPLSNRPVRVAA